MRTAILSLGVLLAVANPVWGEDADDLALTPDTVLVEQGDVTFTVRDFDAATQRIPEDMRAGYMADFKRVVQDLESLLALKVISEQARSEGYLERPEIKAQIAISEDQLLSKQYLDDWVRSQPEPDYEMQAREHYLLNKSRFMAPEAADVSHILIKMDIRSDEEAKALAEEVLAKAKAGDVAFADLAREYSEDLGSAPSGGLYQRAARDGLVKPFADAAFNVEKFDEPFGPVKTEFGYHIMSVHKRYEPGQQTFEEVKGSIIPGLREQHLGNLRQEYMIKIKTADKEVNDEAIKGLREFYAGDYLRALRGAD